MLRNLSAIPLCDLDIDLLPFEGAPELDDAGAEHLDAGVELLVESVHIDEVVTVEVAVLLVLLQVHVRPLHLRNLAQEVLLVDRVAHLVQLRQLVLQEAPHLEHAQHLLLLEQQRVVVRQQLDLEGVREFLNHLEIVQVEQFREETLLGLVYVDFVNFSLFLKFLRFLHLLGLLVLTLVLNLVLVLKDG